jgi:aminoglycoside phosphotransferase (APT) family kinase protein
MRIDSLGSVVSASEFQDGLVVHGDAHFANALWFEGCLVALLDFEWARIGPSDLELEAACREDPIIEDAAESGPIRASEVPMLVWLREGYPDLFNREDLTERLWLYDLCYQVRRLSALGITSLDQLQLKRLNILAAGPRVRFE